MIIREATTKDIDQIHDLGKDVEEFNTTDEVVTFWPKYILKNCVNSKTDFIIIAEEKEIIGFTIANYNPVFKKAIIENIFVHPDFRGQKVGKKLLDNLMAKLEQIGCEYVCILTESNNKNSIKFYQKMGFNRGINCAWLDKVLGDKFSKS